VGKAEKRRSGKVRHAAIEERKVVFDDILANSRVARLAKLGYQTEEGRAALHSITTRAVSIPQEWRSEDKRSLRDKEAHIDLFLAALDQMNEFLNVEQTSAWMQFSPSSRLSRRVRRSGPMGAGRVINTLARSQKARPSVHTSPRGDVPLRVARPSLTAPSKDRSSQPFLGDLLDALGVEVDTRRSWEVAEGGTKLDNKPSRYSLSVYDLHRIILAFKAEVPNYRKQLQLEHDPWIRSEHAMLRHAARELNYSIKPFFDKFNTTERKIKFSRYEATSCFIDALYGQWFPETAYNRKKVYQWCRSEASGWWSDH
jgi:hypothetical protein